MKTLVTILIAAFLCSAALAHPGRTNKQGCHTDKSTGTRH
ncbi:YHYH domain-containing protein, partial [Pseudomonas syringae]